MYMGFMKMGLSLMLGFMILSAIVGYTNLGILSVFPITLYIYSFFHANNLASVDDVTFHNIEDQYLFGFDGIENMNMKLEGRNRKIAALILIVLGVIMLWQVVFNLLCDIFGWDNRFLSAIYYFVRDELPRVIIGIAVIWAGLALIRGKRIGIEEDADFDRQFGDRDHTDYKEAHDADGQSVYREPFAGEEQWFHKDHTAGNGQAIYRDNAIVGEQPAGKVQPGAGGNIIYAGGPVADEQDVRER